ncbi:PREDICTED: uncharacterized protein LOC107191980 [Dufourea novaeangliae]|uniref:Uncharacterized protein n=1 Tax=Dufourea novaeangliae TaxID=178035 RepID=A0A154PPE7_DUFNO|nr:PREDICTED: uncharacterized protein LOC107191980 [Dufourea novaeangliae]KZC13766.1 hypothetical protein WN55_05669 [Dufourea novaeangliae]
MSIYSDIKKVTQIPFTNENSSFIRHRECSMPVRNRKVNKQKPPLNANLYNEDDNENDDDDQQKSKGIPQELHENEIASSIKEANCGINYSNENLEEHWKARQVGASLSTFDKTNSNCTNSCDETENIEDEELVLKKCKLNKNAAIRGLLRNHQISLHDLHIPSNSVDVERESGTNLQNENIPSPNKLAEGIYNMKLVQYPEDPEVFVQPIHAYGKLNENEYKDIDFSVPHIGKKLVVTPRQFYVNMDDSGFDFVKKDVKRKKLSI